jgi:RHS repeat-associated protein
VTRTDGDVVNSGWTFVHGPGLDDPLLGYRPLNHIHAYFLTDGGGRQYGVADRDGATLIGTTTQGQQEYQKAGKYAGGTQRSTSFGAERQQSKSQPGLSFFRNRFYDQATGRWTQEDPIGIAGGINLYQYSGNNPAGFTDPFGLCAEGDAPDSVLVHVKVICPDGKYGYRDVWAHRVPKSDLQKLNDAANGLTGGNEVFTPENIQRDWQGLTDRGAIYVLPSTSADGLPIADGAVTVTGGGFSYTAFLPDVWNAIVAGALGIKIGDLGFNSCTVVGHEGVHLEQSRDSALGTAPRGSKGAGGLRRPVEVQ